MKLPCFSSLVNSTYLRLVVDINSQSFSSFTETKTFKKFCGFFAEQGFFSHHGSTHSTQFLCVFFHIQDQMFSDDFRWIYYQILERFLVFSCFFTKLRLIHCNSRPPKEFNILFRLRRVYSLVTLTMPKF